MGDRSTDIHGNQGDVIGVGVGGSGNVTGKNITVQGDLIQVNLSPDMVQALSKAAAVPTEVSLDGPAGIQGGQVPKNLKSTQLAINQLLELINVSGQPGRQSREWRQVKSGSLKLSYW